MLKKSKMMVFERREADSIQRVSVPAVGNCELLLGFLLLIKEVKESNHFGTAMQTWKGGRRNRRESCEMQVSGSLARIIRGKNMSMAVKRGLRNNMLATLTCGSVAWTWNMAPQSRVHTVGMSYLRGAYGMTMSYQCLTKLHLRVNLEVVGSGLGQ